MEYYGKEKRIYHGMLFTFLSLITVPVMFYFLFYFAISTHASWPHENIIYMSIAFTGVVSVLYYMICIGNGFVSEYFVAFIRRVIELFKNIRIFKWKAVKWYFEDFALNGGIILWLFAILFALSIFTTIFGFTNYFALVRK